MASRLRISLALIALVFLAGIPAMQLTAAGPQQEGTMELSDHQRKMLEMAGIPYEVEAKPRRPEVIAVRVRHNMCPLCRELEPNMREVLDAANELGVVFVTIDISSEESQQQSAMVIGAMGLDAVWPENMASMGKISYVDAVTKRVVGTVQSMSTEEIIEGMNKAVGGVE